MYPVHFFKARGVTHNIIGAVQIAATGVKTWSNGQATLRGARGTVKCGRCIAHVIVNGQDKITSMSRLRMRITLGSKGQGRCGQQVKTYFGRSRIS